jgi:hypothetical protein
MKLWSIALCSPKYLRKQSERAERSHSNSCHVVDRQKGVFSRLAVLSRSRKISTSTLSRVCFDAQILSRKCEQLLKGSCQCKEGNPHCKLVTTFKRVVYEG